MRLPDNKNFGIFKEEDCLHISKGWGEEIILHNSDDFCCKILRYKSLSISSFHIHCVKKELFKILSGCFKLRFTDPLTGKEFTHTLIAGDNVYIPSGQSHQLTCIEEGDILECSTQDFLEDSYRIAPGDSQKQ